MATPPDGLGAGRVLAIGSYIANWGNGFTFGRFEWWFLPLSSVGLLVLTLLRTRLRVIGAVMIAFAFIYEAVKAPTPLPHVLITEDAQLVGLLKQSDNQTVTVATNKRRPPSFIYTQWTAALGVSDSLSAETLAKPRAGKGQGKKDKNEHIPPEDAMRDMQDALEKADPRRDIFFCRTDAFCLARLGNSWTVVLVQNRDYSAAACTLADLIVSTQSTYYAACDGKKANTSAVSTTQTGASNSQKAPPVLIDRDRLRQLGAMEITLGELSTRTLHMTTTFHGEQRPWTRHRYYDWRTNSYKKPEIAPQDIADTQPSDTEEAVNDSDE